MQLQYIYILLTHIALCMYTIKICCFLNNSIQEAKFESHTLIKYSGFCFQVVSNSSKITWKNRQWNKKCVALSPEEKTIKYQ